MKQKVIVHVTEPQEKPVIVHMLEGQAPENFYPQQVKISGDIFTVKEYISTRADQFDIKKSYISFSETHSSIKLIIDESSHIPTIVTATMETYPDLAEFGINTGRYRNRTDMEKLIRMYRVYFPDKDDHAALMANFRAFSARVEHDIRLESDQRGNKNSTNVKKTVSDLATDFIVNIPLFKGGDSKRFLVEICYEVTDSAPRFWMESTELFELQKSILKDEFEDQKRFFSEKGYTVINA